MHCDPACIFSADLRKFDAVCVHYSIRLPYDQLSQSTVEALSAFEGLKFLFIQDEYDHTYRAWHWITRVGFQLVFTVVPELGIERVYPPEKFRNTRFVTNLTGYVPMDGFNDESFEPPSQRKLMIGYRGRPLPVRYGRLGFEKVGIGKLVNTYCSGKGIACDIAWSEESRIYGPAWGRFMRSCRAMLGSESGSNVFDCEGSLDAKIDCFRQANPKASDYDIYEKVVRPLEIDGLMNQVSPRVFEAIAARTVLVLFEGDYSGVVRPDEHFIPLKKDGANLHEVFAKLNDENYIDTMAEQAYRDVIASGRYSYRSFVKMVDRELDCSFNNFAHVLDDDHSHVVRVSGNEKVGLYSSVPIRVGFDGAVQTDSLGRQWDGTLKLTIPVARMWAKIPEPARAGLRPLARRLKRAFLPVDD